jgi:calcineurin-like phosphoesterase family protein
MSSVRFISDLHFYHENKIKHFFENATDFNDFSDLQGYMDTIITNWNKTVHKKDLTYILGDITMECNDYAFLDELNGRKIVVGGNHDRWQHVRELLKYVDGVAGMIKYKSKVHGTIFLTHAAIHPKEFEIVKRLKYNIHGHNHGFEIDDPRYISVCTEKIGYTPRTLDELIKVEKEKL